MTSLAEELAHIPPDHHITCPVATIMQGLNLADRLTFSSALMVNTPSARTLAQVMTDRGHPISAAVIRRHRHRQCARCNALSLGVST